MSEEREKVFGGCHCGAVRYEVVGNPDIWVRFVLSARQISNRDTGPHFD